jgi:hypothetical protein
MITVLLVINFMPGSEYYMYDGCRPLSTRGETCVDSKGSISGQSHMSPFFLTKLWLVFEKYSPERLFFYFRRSREISSNMRSSTKFREIPCIFAYGIPYLL